MQNPLADLRALGYCVICDPVVGGVRLCVTKPDDVIVGTDGIPTKRVYVFDSSIEAATLRAMNWLGVEVPYAVEQAERHP